MEFKCLMFNLLFFDLTYHSLFNFVIFCWKNSDIFKYSLRFTIHSIVSIVKKLLQFKFKLSLLLAHPVDPKSSRASSKGRKGDKLNRIGI